jgi:hypothetical protein
LCGAQEMSESQILNANPLCENFWQAAATYCNEVFFALLRLGMKLE